MTGISYEDFKKILAEYDEFEIIYNDTLYPIYKMPEQDGLHLKVWPEGPICLYDEIINETSEDWIPHLLNEKIFPDGKSIAEAEQQIRLDWYA